MVPRGRICIEKPENPVVQQITETERQITYPEQTLSEKVVPDNIKIIQVL